MKTRVKVEMKPVNILLTHLGVSKTGNVQMQTTRIINKRITRYMPFRTGVLATKSKHIKSATEIEVLSPYARYQYYGKVMVGPAPKVVTEKNLVYTTSKNTKAGPFWDKRMMAAEGKQIAAEIQRYVERKAGKG